jgi:hypothetical protein
MKKVLILFMIINIVLIGMVGHTQYKYRQLQEAIATAGTRGNTDDAVLSSVFDSTNGAIQGIVTGRGTTSLQTTAYTSDAVLSGSFDSTNGALQLILSDNSSDIAFINTTSLTAGDLLYYDATNEEWDNTQGQASIGGIGSSPAMTLKNPTAEDTEGGRESAISVKGIQSGAEESTLGKIQFSHDGTSDDQKGDIIFYTNDGSDNDVPTEAMRIDSAQHVGINITNPLYKLHVSGNSAFNGNVLISAGVYGVFDATAAAYGMRPRNGSDALELRTDGTTRVTIASTGEVTFAQGIVPDAVTSDPCGSGYPEGAIFYNDTANVLCFCDGTNDLKIVDGSACF